MDRINAILEALFGSSSEKISSEETFTTYVITAQGVVIEPFDRAALLRALQALPAQRCIVDVMLRGQDSPHSLGSIEPAALDEFLAGVAYGVPLDPHGIVTLRIAKREARPEEVVFEPDALFRWINDLSLPEALMRFSDLAADRQSVNFQSAAFTEEIATRFFRFSASNPAAQQPTLDSQRAELLIARREQTVSDWNTTNLLSDDFRWTQVKGLPALEKCFAQLENFLAVVSLADSTIQSGEGFSLKVKGTVVRDEQLPWSKVPSKPDISLRSLFEWAYRATGAGPLPDKLGLVRNFISLYWEFGIFTLDVRVAAAVRSGYNLYLKKNLKDFVELRSKVASFIVEIDAKAAKSVETATSNLEKNFYGLTTFIVSVVLIKVLQDKTFTGAFSPQLAILGWALIAISAIHAYFARYSALKEMERAASLYADLRQLYSAFFSVSDFDSIFKSGGKSPVQKTEDYVRSRLTVLMWVWAATLAIAWGLLYAFSKWS